MPRYNHAEAFCLMRYGAVDDNDRPADGLLIIWNSRDGVTPFCIFHEGKEYRHVEWSRDRCVPEHKLYPGDLFFRDQTVDDARAFADRRAKQFWTENAYGEHEEFANEEALRDVLMADMLKHEGAPFLDVYREPSTGKEN